jgi:cell division protein FtsL
LLEDIAKIKCGGVTKAKIYTIFVIVSLVFAIQMILHMMIFIYFLQKICQRANEQVVEEIQGNRAQKELWWEQNS